MPKNDIGVANPISVVPSGGGKGRSWKNVAYALGGLVLVGFLGRKFDVFR